jgi:AraC-like DNA-binding protein
VREACRLLEQADEPLTLGALAARLGCSPYHLQRVFKRVTGLTPRQYAAARRLERAKRAMREGESVTTAFYEAGYGSSRGFYEQASERLGMAPRSYRAGGAGERIAWTVGSCALGRMLLAATGRGICALRIGDDDGALAGELAAEFPAAEHHRDDRGHAALRQAVEVEIGSGEGRLRGAGLGGAAPYSARRDPLVHRAGARARPAARGPRRRPGLRLQPGRGAGSLPSRGRLARRAPRLPLGDREDARVTGPGRVVGAAVPGRPP